MLHFLRSALADHFWPGDRPTTVLQMAALCHRATKSGREVLLITSSNGRWILPKGWPIKGKTGGETAMQEAWEEAGVAAGQVSDAPVAVYPTVKRHNDGTEQPCEMQVYAIDVENVANDFPEAHKRDRRWVSPEKAQGLVDDDDLRALLMAI